MTSDAAIASTVWKLLDDAKVPREAFIEVQRIGAQLNADGGFQRMQHVADCIEAIGGNCYLLNFCWDGIGEWQA